jgi:hypothetical protein
MWKDLFIPSNARSRVCPVGSCMCPPHVGACSSKRPLRPAPDVALVCTQTGVMTAMAAHGLPSIRVLIHCLRLQPRTRKESTPRPTRPHLESAPCPTRLHPFPSIHAQRACALTNGSKCLHPRPHKEFAPGPTYPRPAPTIHAPFHVFVP